VIIRDLLPPIFVSLVVFNIESFVIFRDREETNYLALLVTDVLLGIVAYIVLSWSF